jgi:hypothetical protein
MAVWYHLSSKCTGKILTCTNKLVFSYASLNLNPHYHNELTSVKLGNWQSNRFRKKAKLIFLVAPMEHNSSATKRKVDKNIRCVIIGNDKVGKVSFVCSIYNVS